MNRLLTSMVQIGLLIPIVIMIVFLAIDFHQDGMKRIRNYDLRQGKK